MREITRRWTLEEQDLNATGECCEVTLPAAHPCPLTSNRLFNRFGNPRGNTSFTFPPPCTRRKEKWMRISARLNGIEQCGGGFLSCGQSKKMIHLRIICWGVHFLNEYTHVRLHTIHTPQLSWPKMFGPSDNESWIPNPFQTVRK